MEAKGHDDETLADVPLGPVLRRQTTVVVKDGADKGVQSGVVEKLKGSNHGTFVAMRRVLAASKRLWPLYTVLIVSAAIAGKPAPCFSLPTTNVSWPPF